MKYDKKILIIEDEEIMSGALFDKFTKEGFNVVVGKDGEDGLEKARTEKPDFIITDIVMPKIDGITVMKKIREENILPETPIIILTNLSDPESIADAAAYNASFLVKTDWKLNDIVSIVKEKMGIKD